MTDSQYSSKRFREAASNHGLEPVIPYHKNHQRGKTGLSVWTGGFTPMVRKDYATTTGAEQP